MSEFYVRGLERHDLDRVIHVSPESSLWGLLTPFQLDEVAKHPAWIGFVDDEPVAAGGIIKLWPGLAEAWITVTPLADRHPIFVARHAARFLDVAIEAYLLRRVEAKVRGDFYLAHKFSRWLGFSHECTLFKYGPNGETFHLYARVI